MRCCCDDVGPELMKCPRCGYDMAPRGRSVGAEAASGYCGCEDKMLDALLDDRTMMVEFKEYADATQRRSGLWPGERWGDSLPCLGKPKCVPVAKKDEVE